MTLSATILPAKPADQHVKRPHMTCSECGTHQYPEVRRVKTTEGESGWVLMATCFNCHAVLLAAFDKDERT